MADGGAVPPSTWQPRKIRRDDLRAPMTAEVRRLPAALRDEVVARRRALVDRVAPWGPTQRRRLRAFVVRGAVLVPIVAWITTPVGFGALPWLAPLGAIYGALLALRRPAPLEAACWAMLTGVLVLVLGTRGMSGWGWVSSWILITGVAALVNVRLDLTRLDPEA